MGEHIDCEGFYRVRRIDGKCNNLRNQTWGATAIGMRRLEPGLVAYGEPGKSRSDPKPRDKHLPRKVGIFFGAIILCKPQPAQLYDIHFSR